MMRFIIMFGLMIAVSGSAQASGLSVQSFDGSTKAAPQAAAQPQSIGGDFQKQQQQQQQAAATYKDQPLAASQEYRGYNGRNLEQSFYRCKFESYRTAPPGDQNRGILEKLRIRMYIMDTCMNSEGFFRQKNSFGLDFNYLTSADFVFTGGKN